MTEKPNFFAILPASVRYNKKLTARSKLMYALLTSLAAASGEAYAANAYLAETLDVAERTAARLLDELVREKYISVCYEYKNGTKEIARRYIRINELPALLDLPDTPALYAVIPTHILSMAALSVQAKLLYAEISAATPTDGYCSLPARHFAALLCTSEITVQRRTRELVAADALRVEMEYKGTSKEIARRRIYLTAASDIAEKHRQIATQTAEGVFPNNEPNIHNVSYTPEKRQIRGDDKNDTTPVLPPGIPPNVSIHPNRRRIRRGKRKKFVQVKRE